MRKPASDLPDGGPSADVVPEALSVPTPPPSFPPAVVPPKTVPLPQAGGSYVVDEATGEAKRVEYTRVPGAAE